MTDSPFRENSIFFVETEKIKPNPFQPRREFDEAHLESLADSIRMYGVLQPLVVTRKEIYHENGNMATEYELIAGERRLRASKKAGLREVPVIIRSTEESDKVKLEMAIIENLQREDLNPIDRAKAFKQLVDEFKMTHAEVAKKVGKSREYVSNSMRLLALPEEMLQAVVDKKITEGHARPLLMLSDRPEEQMVLFKEILVKKLTVRDAEKVARRVAYDKVRKKDRAIDPEIVELEEEVSQKLGTRVHIEKSGTGGKIQIDFFSQDDLREIVSLLKARESAGELPVDSKMNQFVENAGGLAAAVGLVEVADEFNPDTDDSEAHPTYEKKEEQIGEVGTPSYGVDDSSKVIAEEPVGSEKPSTEDEGDNLYSVREFNI